MPATLRSGSLTTVRTKKIFSKRKRDLLPSLDIFYSSNSQNQSKIVRREEKKMKALIHSRYLDYIIKSRSESFCASPSCRHADLSK
jgi:hypothetical protein